jgi:hypothetical protein
MIESVIHFWNFEQIFNFEPARTKKSALLIDYYMCNVCRLQL